MGPHKQVKQMKAMEAELDMYKQQVDLFKSDITAANEAMRALRHRWVLRQRRGASPQREGADANRVSSTTSAWDSPAPTAVTDLTAPLLLTAEPEESRSAGGADRNPAEEDR